MVSMTAWSSQIKMFYCETGCEELLPNVSAGSDLPVLSMQRSPVVCVGRT